MSVAAGFSLRCATVPEPVVHADGRTLKGAATAGEPKIDTL